MDLAGSERVARTAASGLRLQEALAEALPNATLATLRSPYGHDAFLVAFDDLRARLAPWLARHLAPSTSFALAG